MVHIIYLIICCFLIPSFSKSIDVIPKGVNFITFAQEHKLWLPSNPLRLHLGCGQGRIEGYVNIDFPASEHTVQKTSGADIFGDITQLAFPAQCADEFRSHHLFEHFPRYQAIALLSVWHYALKVGGIITIETPDFEQSINMITNPGYSYSQKQIIMRHIFGSHEAYWAMHYDGWYEEKFKHTLSTLGFEIIGCTKASYLVLHNITIQARKIQHLDPSSLMQRAKNILRESMVNTSETEETIWQQWSIGFDKFFTGFVLI